MTFQEALSLFQENLQAKLIGSDWKQEHVREREEILAFRYKPNQDYRATVSTHGIESRYPRTHVSLYHIKDPRIKASHVFDAQSSPELASPIADLVAFQILHAFPHHINRLQQWNGNQPSQHSAASSAPTSEEQASPKSDSAPSTKPPTKDSRSANPSSDEPSPKSNSDHEHLIERYTQEIREALQKYPVEFAQKYFNRLLESMSSSQTATNNRQHNR